MHWTPALWGIGVFILGDGRIACYDGGSWGPEAAPLEIFWK